MTIAARFRIRKFVKSYLPYKVDSDCISYKARLISKNRNLTNVEKAAINHRDDKSLFINNFKLKSAQ